MAYIKTADKFFNVAHLAFARLRGPGDLEMHFTVPQSDIPAGATFPVTNPPFVAGHTTVTVAGPDADELWKQLQSL